MDGTNAYGWLYMGSVIAIAFVVYTWAVMMLSAYFTTVSMLRRVIAKRRHLTQVRYLRRWRVERFDTDSAKL